MTTKELLKKIENKSPFALTWSILWRMWVIVLGFYAVLFFLLLITTI